MSTTPLQRYWLFAGSQYYPGGGMIDFITSSDTIEPLRLPVQDREGDPSFRYYSWQGDDTAFNWYHIFDSKAGRVIEACHCGGVFDLEEDRHYFDAINNRGL